MRILPRTLRTLAVSAAILATACGGVAAPPPTPTPTTAAASGSATAGSLTLSYQGDATSKMGSGSVSKAKLAICEMDPPDMQNRQFRVRFSGTIPDAFDPNKTDAVSFEAAGQHLQFTITATGRPGYIYGADSPSLKSGRSGSFDLDLPGSQGFMGMLHLKGTYQC